MYISLELLHFTGQCDENDEYELNWQGTLKITKTYSCILGAVKVLVVKKRARFEIQRRSRDGREESLKQTQGSLSFTGSQTGEWP